MYVMQAENLLTLYAEIGYDGSKGVQTNPLFNDHYFKSFTFLSVNGIEYF